MQESGPIWQLLYECLKSVFRAAAADGIREGVEDAIEQLKIEVKKPIGVSSPNALSVALSPPTESTPSEKNENAPSPFPEIKRGRGRPKKEQPHDHPQ